MMYMWALNRAPDPGACDYYRIKVPLYHLEKLGYMRGYEDRGQAGESDIAAMFTADIDLIYGAADSAILHQMRTINDMRPGDNQVGEKHHPPTLVWDCDDNPDYVHPFNQTYSVNGIRHYPSGDFLEPGEILEWEDVKGEKKVLWEDQVTTALGAKATFDIQRNLQTMKMRWEVIREAVGVTVPSQALASYIKNVIGQKNVYVFPNTVVPEDYEEFPLQEAPEGEVRILWQGGMSHFIDWFPLRGAIAEVMRKHPNAKMVIWGEKFDWITDIIPERQLEFHPWSPYPAFKLKRGLLRTHINLCPLADNPFNWCKSAIKWYEASIWSKPEATLAANVLPYREIVDGQTGLLYRGPEEFVQKLSALIEDANLRRTLGNQAREWVLKNRTPEATIPGLYEFYLSCRARSKNLIVPANKLDLKRLKESVV